MSCLVPTMTLSGLPTHLMRLALVCRYSSMPLVQPLQVLFPAKGELDALDLMWKLLGSPTEESWPGHKTLPNARKVRQMQPSPSQTSTVVSPSFVLRWPPQTAGG